MPATFESQILEMMEVGPLPGAVVGTVRDGKPGWVHPLGVRDIEAKDPVQAETIFQAASLSKQAVAYAALLLVKQGKLDLDRPLVAYVDDLEDERARTVAIRHVLSHSSGFPNWRSEASEKLVPEFAPGSKFRYSGEGYFYLQRVMEEVTGQGFARLMETMVFKPLQMNSTSMVWNPEWATRYATPHGRRGEAGRDWNSRAKRLHELARTKGQTTIDWKYADYSAAVRSLGDPSLPNWMLPNAASSMATTASDYARFLAAAIVVPDILKEQVKIRRTLGWGLGWGVERVIGRTYVWQWGDNAGFKNFVMADPAKGSAIFVFTNGDSGTRVYDRIVTHASGHDHPALFWI